MIMNEQIYLSVIVPVYNSQAFIRDSIHKIDDCLTEKGICYEIIAVNDGSKDNSYALLKEMEGQLINLVALDKGKNGGKGSAIRFGMEHVRGQYVIFIDADLAYPANQILVILKALESGADVAIACRVLKESRYEISPSFFRYLYARHIMGRFFNLIVRWLVLPGILDTQAGLKGFKKAISGEICKKQTLNRFSFDVELLFIARLKGFVIQQVPIFFKYDHEATTVRFFGDTLRMLRDICLVKLNGMIGKYR